jgi:hypothetical protein
MPCSEKKRLANQRNAQKSTGPKTPEGKARSSQNAIKHGIFCVQTNVLKNEDEGAFRFLRQSTIQDLRPQNFFELQLVDAIVHFQWRLRRLQHSEALMYTSFRDTLMDHWLETWTREDGEAGRLRALEEEKYLDANPDHTPCMMARMLIEPGQDQISKMSKYEQRLRNMLHRSLAELRQHRKDRAVIDQLPPSPFEEELPPAPALLPPPEDESDSAEQSQSSPDMVDGVADPVRRDAAGSTTPPTELREAMNASDNANWQNEPTAGADHGPASSSGGIESSLRFP